MMTHYLGERIGMYFGFISFYTAYLMILAAFGLVASLVIVGLIFAELLNPTFVRTEHVVDLMELRMILHYYKKL